MTDFQCPDPRSDDKKRTPIPPNRINVEVRPNMGSGPGLRVLEENLFAKAEIP